MRSLIITLILLSAMCAAIVMNNLYIKSAAKFIEECVSDEKFDHDPQSAIDELDDFWKRNHPIVGLSVGYKELDRLSDLIIDLRVYTELEKSDDVEHVRAMIIESADEISRLERFRLENLL